MRRKVEEFNRLEVSRGRREKLKYLTYGKIITKAASENASGNGTVLEWKRVRKKNCRT